LLLREYDRDEAISLRRFYARRALRLFPALIALVIPGSIAAAIRHVGSPAPDGAAALVYLTDFYANIATHVSLVLHTWSLAIEEQFYLLWPAALLFCLRREGSISRSVVCFVAAGIGLTAAFGVSGRPHLAFLQFLPTSHLAELGSGIILAVMSRNAPAGARRLCGSGITCVALGLLLVAEFALNAHWWAFPAVTLICWPPVAHLVLHRRSLISRAFSAPAAVWLGERSYGFYLYHYPIVMLLVLSGASVLDRVAIGLPATLVATAVSWRYLEQPFLRLKERVRVNPVQHA
jgi:peptidoglycan/LPS O-acetylase OafA/YrhL